MSEEKSAVEKADEKQKTLNEPIRPPARLIRHCGGSDGGIFFWIVVVVAVVLMLFR